MNSGIFRFFIASAVFAGLNYGGTGSWRAGADSLVTTFDTPENFILDVAISSNGNLIAYSEQNTNKVHFLNPDFSLIRSSASMTDPDTIVIDKTSTHAYVAQRNGEKIRTLTIADGSILATTTTTNWNSRCLVALPDYSNLLNCEGLNVVKRSTSDLRSGLTTHVKSADFNVVPIDVAVSIDGTRAFVATDEAFVTLLNTTTMTTTGAWNLPAGASARSLSLDSTGSRLAVGLSTPDVLVLDTSDGSIVQTFTNVGYGAQFDPTGRWLYVRSGFDMVGLDASTGEQVASTTLPHGLTNAVFDPAGEYLLTRAFNPGFISKIRIERPAPAVPTAPAVPIWRASLDPNGGICLDSGTERDAPWTSVFVGYRYLPSTVDCTREGHVFTGWASTDDPTTVVDLPRLTDPTDGERRMFLAANADLVATWTPIPDQITDLTVFANFFCGPCTNAWLLFTMPTDATDYTVSVNDTPTECAQSGKFFDLSLCEITDLTPGPITFSVTPHNVDVDGPATTKVLTLSD